MPFALDHLTVTAATLTQGRAWVETTLGVPMQAGGQHPRMGTHNALLRVGSSVFLEVIAIDPEVPPPARPRWFGLDTLASRTPPRLATWVVRCDDLTAALHRVREPLGQPEPMSRGDLHWHISIPSDGALVMDGAAPSLIDWGTAPHPCTRLEDRGVRLKRLVVSHPELPRLNALLDDWHPLRSAHNEAVQTELAHPGAGAGLQAWFETPDGVRCLSVQTGQ